MPSRIVVLGDSLTFHGPERAEPLTDPRLWPNVCAAALEAQVDVVARLGWTSRDAWWAVTKDPNLWSVLLPRADALVLAVGGMDHLPASLPTWLRESIPYVRPGRLRRQVRRAYRRASPAVIRASGGRLRVLPQQATDHYLTRVVEGVRWFRPGLAVVALSPPPYETPVYPSARHHASARDAAKAWADRTDVTLVDTDPIVRPHLRAGRNNPDGMHWGWECHADIGRAVARALAAAEEGRRR